MDRGRRTGVTVAVNKSDLGFCEGVGRRARAVVCGSQTLVDGSIGVVGGLIGVNQTVSFGVFMLFVMS